MINSLLHGLDWAILVYFLSGNGFYLVLLAAATLEMRHHLSSTREETRRRVLGSNVAPTVSMLVPAYNEAATVGESVRALLTLHYPNLEVVFINDGSSDDTMAMLEREFGLTPIHPTTPNLVTVDKANGRKADALNAGLNVATGALVCAIDADTLIELDALLRMARPFLHGDDVVAAGGTVRVVNGSRVKAGRVLSARAPRNALAGIQAVEYLRAFLFGRLGWNRLGGNLIISGAFGLFRRETVLAAGGYLHGTVGEDIELVARLRRRGVERGRPPRGVHSRPGRLDGGTAVAARARPPARSLAARSRRRGVAQPRRRAAPALWHARFRGAAVLHPHYRQLTAYWRFRGLVKYLSGSTDWGVMTRTGIRWAAVTARQPSSSFVRRLPALGSRMRCA